MSFNGDQDETVAKIVKDLLERCMGNAPIAAIIVDKFEKQLRDDVIRLKDLGASGDAGQMAHTAHALKGAAGATGAAAIYALAGKLEHAAREDRLDSVLADLSDLCNEVDKCLRDLPLVRERLASIGV